MPTRPTIQRALAAACALALTAVTACRSTRDDAAVEAPPRLDTAVRHFAGSPLSGPEARVDPALLAVGEPLAARRISCRIFWLPEGLGSARPAPVAAGARLLFRTRAGNPLLATSRLSEQAFGGLAEDIGAILDGERRAVEIAFHEAALLPGTTASFSIDSPRAVPIAPGVRINWHVDLMVHRQGSAADDADEPGGTAAGGGDSAGGSASGSRDSGSSDAAGPDEPGAQIALMIYDLDAERAAAAAWEDPADETAAAQTEGRLLQEEFVLLADRLPFDRTPMVLGVDSPFEAGGTFVAVLRGGRGAAGVDEFAQVFERARLELERQDAEGRAAEGGERADPQRARLRAFRATLRSLDEPTTQRRGLLFLTRSTGASLAEDLALVADDDVLAAYTERLLDQGVTEGRPGLRAEVDPDVDRIAVALEQTALAFVADRVTDTRASQMLEAALLRRCGEVGRLPSLARDVAREPVQDLAALERLLLRENVEFLDDATAASRVRAYDWLAPRGLVPEGYDPLAPRAERRAVLRPMMDTLDARLDRMASGGASGAGAAAEAPQGLW